MNGVARAMTACFATTVVVVAASYLIPEDWSATFVGCAFLTATYWLSIRHRDDEVVRHHGLSLGGLFETEPLQLKRLLRDGATAVAWALGTAVVVFPPFVVGFVWFWHPHSSFVFAPISTLTQEITGQLFVVALPEEAFYRGYLQTALDDTWKKRFYFFGGYLSPAVVVSSALFAVGHLLTEPNLNRLAVFFPSLLFGWLRTRTKGIGSGVAFHALCNLFSAYLGRSFGMWS